MNIGKVPALAFVFMNVPAPNCSTSKARVQSTELNLIWNRALQPNEGQRTTGAARQRGYAAVPMEKRQENRALTGHVVEELHWSQKL